MTRAERAAARRKNQIRRALKRYRTKQREKKTPVAPAPVERDPVWGNVAATPTPVPAPPAPEPVVAPEPEPMPKQEIPYVRRAARGPKPEPAVPLAKAFDPKTGRRRVVINGEDYDVGLGGGDSIMDFEN